MTLLWDRNGCFNCAIDPPTKGLPFRWGKLARTRGGMVKPVNRTSGRHVKLSLLAQPDR